MISSDVLRGYNDVFILRILADSDLYGYAISKEIFKRSNNVYSIKETTLYSAFNRLQKNGFVSTYSGDETQGRQRTYLTITDKGRKYLEEKAIEWQITKELVDAFMPENARKAEE